MNNFSKEGFVISQIEKQEDGRKEERRVLKRRDVDSGQVLFNKLFNILFAGIVIFLGVWVYPNSTIKCNSECR
jgi:hypothetical protein